MAELMARRNKLRNYARSRPLRVQTPRPPQEIKAPEMVLYAGVWMTRNKRDTIVELIGACRLHVSGVQHGT